MDSAGNRQEFQRDEFRLPEAEDMRLRASFPVLGAGNAVSISILVVGIYLSGILQLFLMVLGVVGIFVFGLLTIEKLGVSGKWLAGLTQEIIGGIISGGLIILFVELRLLPSILGPELGLSELVSPISFQEFYELTVLEERFWPPGETNSIRFIVKNTKSESINEAELVLHLRSLSTSFTQKQIARIWLSKDSLRLKPARPPDLALSSPDKHFAWITLGAIHQGQNVRVVVDVVGPQERDVILTAAIQPHGKSVSFRLR